MSTGVSVRELKQILVETESPRKLADPVSELPLWDEQLINQIKAAKTIEEARSAENQLREVMVSSQLFVYFFVTQTADHLIFSKGTSS